MKEAECRLLDLREQVKAALQGMSCPFEVSVRQSFPREDAEGVIVTYQECDNHATAVSVVDYVEYRVDLWAYDRETLSALAEEVNRVLTGLGFKRVFMGEISLDNGTYEHKTMRFGGNIDKRWLRFVR